MRPEMEAFFLKQKYRLYGDHSGVKLCHWLKEKLLRGRSCYKEDFYGISCHRCLQMTPSLNQCTQRCQFCWRFQGFTETDRRTWDEPEALLDGLIRGQRDLITGYKGNDKCDLDLFEEAWDPNMVAISLSGEPTMYPYLSDLIGLCKRRGMSVFVVSNGTLPEKIEALDELPTQLYVTVAAPNREIYKNLCIPYMKDGWERINRTLELLPSLDCRTTIRHTLVENRNIGWEEEYARLDKKADPDIIEPKGYVFVGGSRSRLSMDNMPSHERVRSFSSKLAELVGHEIKAEKKSSRVTAVSSLDTLKIPGL